MYLQCDERNPDLQLSFRARGRFSSDGWLLAGLIVVISAVILALAGITFFLTEHVRVVSLRQNQTKAIYLAQAGVMQAIYDFRTSASGNGFTPGTYDAVPGDSGAPGLGDDDVFILGGQGADFLLAAMIPATLGSTNSNPGGGCSGGTSRNRLESWTLRNVRLDSAISFSQIIVTWNAQTAGQGVVRLDFNGISADWTAPGCNPVASGVPIPVPTQTINAGSSWGTNRVWFATSTMGGQTWIEIAFVMDDNPNPPSTRRARFVVGNHTASSASFTIKSIGEVRSNSFPFTVWRRLQAEYRLNDADTNVSDLQELGKITTDTALLIAPPVPADERPGYKELAQRQP